MDNSNQIRVITSNDLIQKALSKFKVDVSYYIVGRFKTTEVYNYMPFNVSVRLLNDALYEADIFFKILDENRFQLSYKKGEEEIKKEFEFNQKVEDSDFLMTVNKNEMLSAESFGELRQTDYLIRIHNAEGLVNKIKNNYLNKQNFQ